MPRKPGLNLPGTPKHIVQRGNNRAPCFFDESDYIQYLDDLKVSAKNYQCQIHGYVLMTNHVHLLASPSDAYSISQMMQALGRRYVYFINQKYGRTGTLWEGRYRSCLVDSEAYLLTCMRYIELNPVRAGMVGHPAEYPWSSYKANAFGEASELISSHSVYMAIGLNDYCRLKAYRELFRDQIGKELIHDIRESLNHELVLGRSKFKDWIEQETQRQTRLGRAGRPNADKIYNGQT